MTYQAKAAARFPRAAAFAVLLVLATAAPAAAAGTGGIEVTPIPGVVDGRQVTAFRVALPGDGTKPVEFALRNITDQPRSARVYAAAARPDGQGGFTVGDAGSSQYVSLDDRTVQLSPQEVQVETFDVIAADERPTERVYAAVVVEVQQGAIVQRAATLVYIAPGRALSLPVLVVLAAAGLLALAGLGVLVVAVRRRRAQAAAP